MTIMPIKGAYERSASFHLFGFEHSPGSFGSDEDWIKIDFLIKNEKQVWHVIDASLTAAEVLRLSQWLHDLGSGKEVVKELHFWEPNLSFELSYDYGKTKNILITFHAELKPAWHKEQEPYSMLGHMGNRQLKMIADSLSQQLDELYIKAGCYAPL